MASEVVDNLHNEKSLALMEKHKGASLLFREDFDSGPVSVDLIEDNLWLGNHKIRTFH